MFDRSDMHLALLADVMCGEELWPQLFDLAFHHDFSLSDIHPSSHCIRCMPIQLTHIHPFSHRVESVGSTASWRGGKPPAYHRPSRRGASLSDRRIAFGSEALCLSAIYYKVFVRITRHPAQPVLARILRLFRIHARILREGVPCRLGMSRQLRGGVGSPAEPPAYRATQLDPAQ